MDVEAREHGSGCKNKLDQRGCGDRSLRAAVDFSPPKNPLLVKQISDKRPCVDLVGLVLVSQTPHTAIHHDKFQGSRTAPRYTASNPSFGQLLKLLPDVHITPTYEQEQNYDRNVRKEKRMQTEKCIFGENHLSHGLML